MRVWPVLLILSACGTNVTTSPANPTSADQVVTGPDAEPAETAAEAAAAPPDARPDSGSDAPREVAPDVTEPDVAQDTADAQQDAPEVWVWRPRDAGREAEAEASPPEPLVVPVDFRYGEPGYGDLDCPGSVSRDVAMVDVVLPARFTVVSYEFDVAIKNTGGTIPGIFGVCGGWTADGVPMTSVSFDSILGNTSSVEVVRHVSLTVPTYKHFLQGQRVAFYIGQEEGQAHYTGTVTFR